MNRAKGFPPLAGRFPRILGGIEAGVAKPKEPIEEDDILAEVLATAQAMSDAAVTASGPCPPELAGLADAIAITNRQVTLASPSQDFRALIKAATDSQDASASIVQTGPSAFIEGLRRVVDSASQKASNGIGTSPVAPVADPFPARKEVALAPDSGERKRLYDEHVAACKAVGVKMTEEKLARRAKSTWRTRDPIAKWKQCRDRSNDDALIRAAIAKGPLKT